MDIAKLRREYPVTELRRSQLKSHPEEQLKIWIEDARAAKVLEPNAMILSTASKEGRPSIRTVLLKGLDQNGLVFYTDYRSRKGKEIAENPRAAAAFLWLPLARQAIVEGEVEKISRKETKNYFSTRPRESRISASVSKQDDIVSSREVLDSRWEEARKKYENKDVPLPDTWGGYRLIPNLFEFWQGRQYRLHDRFRYRLEKGLWIIERLSP